MFILIFFLYILECADEWGKSEVWLGLLLLLLTTRQTENMFVVVVCLLEKLKRGLWLSKELMFIKRMWNDICYTISYKCEFDVENANICFLFYFLFENSFKEKSFSFLYACTIEGTRRGRWRVEKYKTENSSWFFSPISISRFTSVWLLHLLLRKYSFSIPISFFLCFLCLLLYVFQRFFFYYSLTLTFGSFSFL